MIELKATVVRKGDVIISDGWVSSGFWAIRKEALSNAAMFRDEATVQAFTGGRVRVRTMPEENVEALVPKGNLVECIKTPVTIAVGYERRQVAIFRRDDAYVGVNIGYLKALGLEDVSSVWQAKKIGGPVLAHLPGCEDAQVMIMPIELDEPQLAYLAPIQAPQVAQVA